MAAKNRINKTLTQKVLDLDAHLFLLRTHLHELCDSASHLKAIAAELRTLVCLSSGTEGLLWRLTEELVVDDHIYLHVPGKLKQDHPLVRGLQFLVAPIRRGGKGDPRLKPDNYSLREIIKESEALVATGKPLTHEYLIKAVAQQMGTAHEDEGLEPALAQLSGIFLNGVEPFVEVLAIDAELTLEVGERVLEFADRKKICKRPDHGHDYGNVSIVLRVQVKRHLAGRLQLCRFHSYVSSISVAFFATPTGFAYSLAKHGTTVKELSVPYPVGFTLGDDLVVVFSYCSRIRQARTMITGGVSGVVECDLGWVHAAELHLEDMTVDHKEFVEQRFLLAYQRLLSSKDVVGLQELPPNGYGLWKFSDELAEEGPFPS